MNNKGITVVFFVIIISVVIMDGAINSLSAKEKKSIAMEETKVKGEVEKPEFINIIQRRRIEFKDKGELNTSFKDKIYAPIIKHEFENEFSHKVDRVIDRGSINK